jgi:hypothetical protein
MWQAESAASSMSSGFASAGSPWKVGSAEPVIAGLPGISIRYSREKPA